MADIHSFEPFWGAWRIVRPLGQGSYGKVYLVQRQDFGETYYAALKHLSIPADPQQTRELYADGLVSDDATARRYYTQMLNALINEIKVNDRLKGHTNIVSYEEHSIVEKRDAPGYDVFIRMEYLTSLTDHIRQHSMTVEDVTRLGEDICSALVVLKRERIVHRDIKPANIFLNKGGDFKLGDFGVARTMDKTVSSMSVKGTFLYMAPEVARGEDGSFGVDIYSLGLVMYKLLNGNRAPFLPPLPAPVTHDDTMLAQKRRFQGEQIPPPACAPGELADIVLKACAYRPADRWSSPEEMRAALARCRAMMPVQTARSEVLGAAKDPGGRTAGSGSLRAPASFSQWSMPSVGTIPPAEPPAPAAELYEPDGNETVIMTEDEYPPAFARSVVAAAVPPAENDAPPSSPGGGRSAVVIAGAAAAILALGVGAFFLSHSSSDAAEPPASAPSLSAAVAVSAPPTPAATPTPAAAATPTPAPEESAEPTAEPSGPMASASPTPKASAAVKSSRRPVSTPAPVEETADSEPVSVPAYVPVTGISLSTGSAMLDVGSSLRLAATVSPANASEPWVSWSSSSPGVASVDGSGNVSTHGPGTAVITASCGGFTASCAVTVT